MRNNVADYTLDAKLIVLRLWKKCVIRLWVVHFISSPMLNIGKLWIFYLENFHQGHIFIFKITKAHNGFKTEQNESLHTLNGCPVLDLALAEKVL